MDHLTMEACLGNKDWASTIASNEKKLTSALEKSCQIWLKLYKMLHCNIVISSLT